MNEIAARLGEVGLPGPVAELARRRWDAILVGGGSVIALNGRNAVAAVLADQGAVLTAA